MRSMNVVRAGALLTGFLALGCSGEQGPEGLVQPKPEVIDSFASGDLTDADVAGIELGILSGCNGIIINTLDAVDTTTEPILIDLNAEDQLQPTSEMVLYILDQLGEQDDIWGWNETDHSRFREATIAFSFVSAGLPPEEFCVVE